MTRLPKENDEMRKGAWDAEEDEKLRRYVETYGTGNWRSVGKKAGLQRCGKSCRLRWTNYLRPDIRHGSFTLEEEDLIIKLHAANGSRWSLIAAQMPGRTDNDIKNHWNTRLKKKLCDTGIDPVTHKPIAELLRDLAGSMAQSSESGSQVLAEEAARRYFRDSLVNKAVQDFALVSGQVTTQASTSSVDYTHQHAEELVSSQENLMNRSRDIAAQRYSPGTSGYNSQSVDNSYNSTDDADLSSRSVSPPFSAALEHSHQSSTFHASAEYQSQANQSNPFAGASGTSSGQSPHNYQSQLASTSSHIGDVAHLSTFPESGASFNQFGVARPLRPAQPIRTDFARWLSSRGALPQAEEHLSQLSRFGSELQNINQLVLPSDYQNHDHLSEIMVSNYNVQEAGVGKAPVDVSMNLRFKARPSILHQENTIGSTSSTFTGALISPTSCGHSLMDIASTSQQGSNLPHGYVAPSIFPFTSSGALVSPQSGHLPGGSVFHSPSIMGPGTPTEMRLLDQFEVPSPRMELWDF